MLIDAGVDPITAKLLLSLAFAIRRQNERLQVWTSNNLVRFYGEFCGAESRIDADEVIYYLIKYIELVFLISSVGCT